MIIEPTDLHEQAELAIRHLNILCNMVWERNAGKLMYESWYCDWEVDELEHAIKLVKRIMQEHDWREQYEQGHHI